MAAKLPTATSALALQGADTAPVGGSGDLTGRPGSKQALARLTEAMAELKAMSARPLLERAVTALNTEDYQAGTDWALKGLEKDERNGFGWYLLAMAREGLGDYPTALKAYETALQLIPEQVEIANDLGRLAHRMGMHAQAEKLFRHFLARHPNSPDCANNLACVLRDEHRYEEAIELLRPAIVANPETAALWNTMGTIVTEQGDPRNAEIFYNEAIRLNPDFGRAIYNLGCALTFMERTDEALARIDRALQLVRSEEDRQLMTMARSTALIIGGRLGEGWDAYEARLHPAYASAMSFQVEAPRWSPDDDLAGKSLLVVAEQGLGDEILFANVLPDVLEALGPEGRLTVAVEPRLVPYFQRSFPQASVGPHAVYQAARSKVWTLPFVDDFSQFDRWAPMASLMRRFRRSLADFPSRPGYMTPDPERVAYWRGVLDEQAPPGARVGLLWKSAIKDGARHRFFSPFAQWAPVLSAEGACFVNLQYGDCSAELAQARRDLGVTIWNPPGIDLKQDLDDVAALCAAMDLVIGFSNATFNIAAAAGTPAWLISTPGAWPRLGTARYPWYPQARTFTMPAFGDWTPIMETVGDAARAWIAERA
ncbi:MAG: tetratricopeptide repeat protein [Pseudomonadota bacterium]|jgi:tetratricopeptide (TPR) repeat protein